MHNIFYCIICGEDVFYHAWIEARSNALDHPFISDNLEYLEYLYNQKEKQNVK